MSPAPRNSQASKPPKPQTGHVRWISRPAGPTLYGRFSITVQTTRGQFTTEYDIAAVLGADGEVVGLGLAKDDDTIHHIDVSQPWGWTCDCPDSQFRNRECKHIRAARAALSVAGVQLHQKVQPAPSVCQFDDP